MTQIEAVNGVNFFSVTKITYTFSKEDSLCHLCGELSE